MQWNLSRQSAPGHVPIEEEKEQRAQEWLESVVVKNSSFKCLHEKENQMLDPDIN